MIHPDRIGATVVIAVGAGFLGSALSIPPPSIGDPLGPRVFPVILGGLMMFLGLMIFIKPEKDLEAFSLGKTFLTVLLMAGLLGVYGYTLPWVGYPLGTFLFLFLTSRLLKEKSWVLGLLLSAGLSLGIYALFTKALGIPLPLGVIEIIVNG